jgi:hypothetical protein
MTDLLNRIAVATGDHCPATFGRERSGHSVVTVSRSSYRDAPYSMCSKCGAILSARGVK